MSIRPTQQIDSYARLPSVTDKEIRTREAKDSYYHILIIIIIDFIISALMIVQECGIFSGKDNKYLFMIIELSIITIFFILISILLALLRPLLSIFIKYIYLILGGIYYIYKIIFHIFYMISNFEDVYWLDFLFVFLALVSIVPRVLFWYNANILIPKVKLIADCKDGEDHDKLLQKVGSKMDRGDTVWSSIGGKSERQTNFLTMIGNKKTNSNDKFKYSIKDNYIEEEEIKNEETYIKEDDIKNEKKEENGGGN